MDKCLERYNPLRLNQEEIDNLKRQITSSEIEFVIFKNSQQTKPRTSPFHREGLANIYRKPNMHPSQNIPKS